MRLCVASFVLLSGLVTSAALAQTPARSCVRVEVTSSAAGVPASRSALVPNAPRFSATKILDLTFAVLFAGRSTSGHLVELRIFTPDGHLYRSMAMPVAGRGQAARARAVEGYARPVAERPLTQVTRGRGLFSAAATTFPVAGTDIVSSGLYGRWRVEAYVDGSEQRCAPASWFTLNR
jgi:hypothetical protein